MTERHHGKQMAPVAAPTIERRRQLIVTATPLGFRPQHSSCRSDCHSDASDATEFSLKAVLVISDFHCVTGPDPLVIVTLRSV
ncbi:hypothetical protein AVEN_198874-1 [Araneus ventricosus]|uniref:Uncharacterized protein n=1 Tax=Araneus ventricosus TaxID=182803 RepID=A0A4Y2SZ32_ARAVE|nr:hypothetical protein AVEN_198874-1 [Araneus ventricosus]